MSKKVLVTYATKRGSTTEVAEFIGQTLREVGFEVDVQNVKQVKGVDGYDAVVVGSAIRIGNWLAEAKNFLKKHKARLSQVPLAYFTVCITLAEDTPEHREEVAGYLKPVRDILPAQAEGYFAGFVDVDNLPFIFRMMVKQSEDIKEGDFRDWDAIKGWALDIKPLLLGEAETSPA